MLALCLRLHLFILQPSSTCIPPTNSYVLPLNHSSPNSTSLACALSERPECGETQCQPGPKHDGARLCCQMGLDGRGRAVAALLSAATHCMLTLLINTYSQYHCTHSSPAPCRRPGHAEGFVNCFVPYSLVSSLCCASGHVPASHSPRLAHISLESSTISSLVGLPVAADEVIMSAR